MPVSRWLRGCLVEVVPVQDGNDRGHRHGVRAPRTAALICMVLAVLNVLGGVMWASSIAESHATNPEAVQLVPAPVAVVMGVFGGVGWWLAGVFFDWLAALFAVVAPPKEPPDSPAS